MANSAKTKQKIRKSRRLPCVDLQPNEFQRLKKIWTNYRGGHRGFARLMARKENPGIKDLSAQIEAKAKCLLRAEEKKRISTVTFGNVADALGLEPEQLLEKLSGSTAPIPPAMQQFPWIAEEEVIKQYRAEFHHYHFARRDISDLFWVYTPIDFTAPRPGFLYGSTPFGLHGKFRNTAYGYLFREMLLMIMKSEEGTKRMESIHIYYEFRIQPFGSSGNFGVVFSENTDGTKGVAGSLLFANPFPGTGQPGRQDSALCDRLTEYWRLMDGPRANRILRLFGYEDYERPEGHDAKMEAILKGT